MHRITAAETSININPPIPRDIAGSSFEINLLGRMLPLVPVGDGYRVNAAAHFSDVLDLTGLRRFAMERSSPLIDAIRPFIDLPPGSNMKVTRPQIAEAMGIASFEVEHVLQEICRLHEDRVPHFELTWSHAVGGRSASGAAFITPDFIHKLDPQQWLSNEKAMVAHDNLQFGMEWEPTDRDRWEIELPPRNWIHIALRYAPEAVVIRRSGQQFTVDLIGHEDEGARHIGICRTLTRAMRIGAFAAQEAELSAEGRLLKSMGLDEDDWEIVESPHTPIMARSLITWEVVITFEPGNMEFTLWNDREILASRKDPQDFKRFIPSDSVSYAR